MADGTTNRRALRIRRVERIEDVDGALRDVEQWARRLPFAACGFRATAVAAGGNFAIGANIIKYDTFLDNRESWVFDTAGRVVVPRGKSGLYILNMQVLFGGADTTTAFGGPTVNGFFVTQGTQEAVSQDRVQSTAPPYLLQEGDVIGAQINFAAAQAFGQTIITAGINYPVLSAWRIALLPDSVTH